MSLVALLSWFDERTDWLTDTVWSLAQLDVTALVAVDGAYSLLPGGVARSPSAQRDAIQDTAAKIGIACAVHEHPEPWVSEVEKRAFMFHAGQAYAKPGDWFFIIDGDEVVVRAPEDLMDQLEAATCDAAIVALLNERFGEDVSWAQWGDEMPTVALGRKVWPLRCLFRAIPGLTVQGRHWDYLTPDGRNLWGDNLEKALILPDLWIDHRNAQRDPERDKARQDYYKARDAAGIERKATIAAPALQE